MSSRIDDVSEAELEQIKKAFEKEEFRKLFADYVQEISDPKNKELYEKEIIALEAEQGNKAQLISPEPGFVVKTWLLGESKQKVFINICYSDKVDKATSKTVTNNGKKGQNWTIPYSLGQKRLDKDHSGADCLVWDCCFHPQVYNDSLELIALKKLLIGSAFEGIEEKFNLKLCKEYKILKIKSKGTIQATIIREKVSDLAPNTSTEFLNELMNSQKKPLIETISNEPIIKTPKYSIVHIGNVDYSRITNARNVTEGSRPDAICIKIELPNVASAAEIQVDITSTRLELNVAQKYHLEMDLPFEVRDEDGTAKFEKTLKTLTLELPVVPKIAEIPEVNAPLEEDVPQLVNSVSAVTLEEAQEPLQPQKSFKSFESTIQNDLPLQQMLFDLE